MAMLSVGESASALSAIKDPSEFTWGLQDVSDPEAGRTQVNAKMYKGRIAQKRTISLSWAGTTPAETAAILQAFNPEYIFMSYTDPMSNTVETREFYTGDRSAPMQQ